MYSAHSLISLFLFYLPLGASVLTKNNSAMTTIRRIVGCDFTNSLYQQFPLILPFDAMEKCKFSIVIDFLAINAARINHFVHAVKASLTRKKLSLKIVSFPEISSHPFLYRRNKSSSPTSAYLLAPSFCYSRSVWHLRSVLLTARFSLFIFHDLLCSNASRSCFHNDDEIVVFLWKTR